MESIKYLKKNGAAPFFHFLTIFFGKIPGILTIFGETTISICGHKNWAR